MRCRKTRVKTWRSRDGALLMQRVDCGGKLDDNGRCEQCGGVRWRKDRPGAPLEMAAGQQRRLW